MIRTGKRQSKVACVWRLSVDTTHHMNVFKEPLQSNKRVRRAVAQRNISVLNYVQLIELWISSPATGFRRSGSSVHRSSIAQR